MEFLEKEAWVEKESFLVEDFLHFPVPFLKIVGEMRTYRSEKDRGQVQKRNGTDKEGSIANRMSVKLV